MVGSKMMEVLEERHFPVTELLPVASSRSWGKKVKFQGKEWTVMSADEAIAKKPVLAIFSAGGSASGELAPKFAAIGCYVVDNSSFWRMDPNVPLVVPEINADVLEHLESGGCRHGFEYPSPLCGELSEELVHVLV